MALYWVIFGIIAFFSLIEQYYQNEKISLRMFYFIVLILFCLSFLRWERGSDWYSYYYMFLYGPESKHTEIGYSSFLRLIRRFTDNYTFFLFLQGAIYYTILISLIKKFNYHIHQVHDNIPNLYSTILLFFYSQDFAGIFAVRSSIAYIICLYAFFDIIEKKVGVFIVKIIIASLFHRSALVFLVAYPLVNYAIFNIKYVSILFVVCVLMFGFSSYYVPFLQKVGFADYVRYIGDTRNSYIGIVKWGGILVGMVLLRHLYQREIYDGILILFSVGFVLFIWSQLNAPVAQRIAFVFLNISSLWLFYIVKIPIKYGNLIYIFFIIYEAVCLWSLLTGSFGKLFYPYKFFWDTFYVEVF